MNVSVIASVDVADRVANGAVIIDVREVFEYVVGHIPGSKNIPLSEFVDRVAEVPKENVIVVCRSGGRSAEAARYLLHNGYVNIVNLVEGTVGWKAAGFELE